MSRRRSPAEPARSPQPPPRPWTSTRRKALAASAVVLLAAGVAAALLWARTRPLPPFPPPVPAAVAAAPDPGAFAGADACRSCHATEHAAWAASTHGRAGGTPAERPPSHAFDGRAIRFRDGTVLPQTAGSGELRFVVQQEGRPAVTIPVEAIVGAAALYGGGTQAYLTRHVDGTVRVLPWEQTRDGDWFCNTGTRADRGWQPITPDMRLADCGDWPPQRVLGSHRKLGHCQECHGSGIESAGDRTRWRSLAIDCESCHGPARAHIEAVRDGRGGEIGSLLTLTKEESVQLCLRCHSLKDALPARPAGSGSGSAAATEYSIGLSVITGEDLFVDGRTRTFAYQEGHLYSACYLNGGMTCVDCHAPHEQTYRSFQGQPLPGRFDDRQCTGCHLSKTIDVPAHTRHRANSPGSRCTACHMPYLQQPEVGSDVAYARSDHTISIPRPDLDSVLRVRGACASCHEQMSDMQLARTLSAWYGEPKPLPTATAALLRDTLDVALPVILAESAHQPMATLAALGRALRLAALGGSTTLSRETRAALARAGAATDPDQAAAALALLHFTHGDERRTRRVLIDVLRSHPDVTAVRARWVTLLGWLGDLLSEADDARRAVQTYEKALELDAAHGPILRALGYARLRLGDHAGAADAFRAAVESDRGDALAHIGLGVALAAAGNGPAAAAAYRAALSADAHEPLAHFNLGNVALRAGRHAEAMDRYRRALELDPGMPSAYFNLARAQLAAGRYADAAAAIRNGLELDPDNDAAAQMLAQLRAAGYEPAGRDGGRQ
jgi:tetratricopeptide (TPR) repeat protein